MAKVTADMTIAKILEICPDARKIFMRHGMYCIGCAVGESESLSDAAEIHQISIEDLLLELNKEE
jgi:hybrid cluster-associated redox disulfide protein